MAFHNNSHKWYELDNAAIIIPGSVRGSDTRVFRITCELKEDVDPDILQKALDQVLPEFSYLNCALRKGLFWYYLDSIPESAKVGKDHLPALSPLYFPGRYSLLYRVTYYGRRINLEMFHVLADGTGAFVFFRSLVTEYLSLRHGITVTRDVTETSSGEEKSSDAFSQYYRREKKSSQLRQMTSTRAYQVKGEHDPNQQNHLIEGIVSAGQFVDLAHQYHTTVGVLITALVIDAIVKGMSVHDRAKKPVVISVPVNLRRFFPSETIRNFFGVINVRYDASGYDGKLEPVIAVVKQSFAEQLVPEKISQTMNSYSALAGNFAVKLIPNLLKEPGLKFFTSLTKSGVTGSVSNLERIRMPEEIAGYIDHFAAFMSAIRFQITIASYGDKLVFGSAGSDLDHRMMLQFYRTLTKLGLSVTIATNDYNEE